MLERLKVNRERGRTEREEKKVSQSYLGKRRGLFDDAILPDDRVAESISARRTGRLSHPPQLDRARNWPEPDQDRRRARWPIYKESQTANEGRDQTE